MVLVVCRPNLLASPRLFVTSFLEITWLGVRIMPSVRVRAHMHAHAGVDAYRSKPLKPSSCGMRVSLPVVSRAALSSWSGSSPQLCECRAYCLLYQLDSHSSAIAPLLRVRQRLPLLRAYHQGGRLWAFEEARLSRLNLHHQHHTIVTCT